MIDELILALNVVCNQLLPVLGAATLIFLILFLKRCIKLVEECTKRVQQLETTVQGVDKSIEKLQAPLDTVVKVSATVDHVQESAGNAAKQFASYVSENFGTIKESLAKNKPASNIQSDIQASSQPAEEGEK